MKQEPVGQRAEKMITGTSSSLGLLKKGSRFMGLNSANEASVGGGTNLPGGWDQELVDEINYSKYCR